jgi:peptidoglycan/LPS O-acetylase OafA/YrhL
MWQNLLYINDLFDVTQSCAIWTWYLANDMQFFILAPFFILSLHFLPFFGHLLMLGVLGASIASCMILTRIHHLDAFWVSALLNLLQGGSLDGSSLMGITKYIYFKPWARIQPYLIGIYMGYMLKKWDMSFFKSTTRTLIGYVFAGLIMFASVFGLRKAQLGYPLTQLENMMYIGLSRIGWSISLGYLVMEHILGNGFFIKKMLSLPFWIPLARLSYGAYLLHPIFIEWFYFSLNQPFNFSVISIFFTFGGVVVVSFCAAAALSVFIESPFRKLTKLVFSYKRKSQREPPEVVVHQKDPEVPASAG